MTDFVVPNTLPLISPFPTKSIDAEARPRHEYGMAMAPASPTKPKQGTSLRLDVPELPTAELGPGRPWNVSKCWDSSAGFLVTYFFMEEFPGPPRVHWNLPACRLLRRIEVHRLVLISPMKVSQQPRGHGRRRLVWVGACRRRKLMLTLADIRHLVQSRFVSVVEKFAHVQPLRRLVANPAFFVKGIKSVASKNARMPESHAGRVPPTQNQVQILQFYVRLS
ncbi:hypothetical protein B0H10DRAFT_1965243 [Mycena sp. CBHHK59/15]|nr:hypothetical protein B0H10DRAFT_1965243 [Mycena sp. CBHHK59/15]